LKTLKRSFITGYNALRINHDQNGHKREHHFFDSVESTIFAIGDSLMEMRERVGRTLLSGTFHSLEAKVKCKSGGQECPPHMRP